MLRKKLPLEHTSGLDYGAVAATTDGFSGSDITLLCKEAAMGPLRRLMVKLEADDAATNPEREWLASGVSRH